MSQEGTSYQFYKDEILSALEELSIEKVKEVLNFINFLKNERLLKRIDPDQAYFWTKEWQEGEREADEDIKSGRIKSFNSVDDLIAELKE